jgi:trigger factor
MIDGHKKNLTSRFGKTEPRDEVTEKTTVKADFVQLDQEGNPLEEGIVVNDSVMSMAVMKDEELKKKFIGSKVGDSIVFDPKKAFPNDTELSYLLRIDKEQAEQLGGDFSCTIKEISEYVDPELDQDMYNQIFGPGLVTSEEEFNQKVKEELTRTFAMESEYQFARDAREKLVDKTEMQLPEAFLRRWLKATNKREESINDEQLEKEMPGFLKDLKWQLIRNEIVKSNELKIENEDVLCFARKAARLQFMQYGLNNVPDEYIDNYATDMLKKEENQRNYAEGAINDKVMAFIKESVKLDTKEVSRDEFNKLYDEN